MPHLTLSTGLRTRKRRFIYDFPPVWANILDCTVKCAMPASLAKEVGRVIKAKLERRLLLESASVR